MKVFRSEPRVVGLARFKGRKVLAAVSIVAGAAGTALLIHKIRILLKDCPPDQSLIESLKNTVRESLSKRGFVIKNEHTAEERSPEEGTNILHEVGVVARDDHELPAEYTGSKLLEAGVEAVGALPR